MLIHFMLDENVKRAVSDAKEIAKDALTMLDGAKTEEDLQKVRDKLFEMKPIRDSLE